MGDGKVQGPVFSSDIAVPCDLILLTVSTQGGTKIPIRLRFAKTLGIGDLIKKNPNEIARLVQATVHATLELLMKPSLPTGVSIHTVIDELPASILQEEPDEVN
jgi:hypothetical protein